MAIIRHISETALSDIAGKWPVDFTSCFDSGASQLFWALSRSCIKLAVAEISGRKVWSISAILGKKKTDFQIIIHVENNVKFCLFSPKIADIDHTFRPDISASANCIQERGSALKSWGVPLSKQPVKSTGHIPAIPAGLFVIKIVPLVRATLNDLPLMICLCQN